MPATDVRQAFPMKEWRILILWSISLRLRLRNIVQTQAVSETRLSVTAVPPAMVLTAKRKAAVCPKNIAGVTVGSVKHIMKQ